MEIMRTRPTEKKKNRGRGMLVINDSDLMLPAVVSKNMRRTSTIRVWARGLGRRSGRCRSMTQQSTSVVS